MLSKARQLLFRPARRRGPAGGGLFDRMRATSFAMLGGTAAFCLVLVAIMAQQGVPYLPALPIPGVDRGDEAVSDAAAVARIGDPISVLIPAPAGVPAGPDRIPVGNSDGTDSGGRRDSGSSGPDNDGSSAPDPGPSPDLGSGAGSQPPTSTPPPTSSPQSSPVANPAPTGSNNGSGSQSASGGKAEADAVSAAGGGSPAPKPVGTAATTAAQQAAAPPASAPPAPAPSSPSAAEEAAAEKAAASP